jgi:hypothetical protein
VSRTSVVAAPGAVVLLTDDDDVTLTDDDDVDLVELPAASHSLVVDDVFGGGDVVAVSGLSTLVELEAS